MTEEQHTGRVSAPASIKKFNFHGDDLTLEQVARVAAEAACAAAVQAVGIIARTIKAEIKSIAQLRATAGLSPSLSSARSLLENQLRGAVGWAGTGCAWTRLPAHKMADVERELDVMRREAHAAEMGSFARRTAEAREAGRPDPKPTVPASIVEYRADEKVRMLQALNATGWNRKAAAQMTGIRRRTFYRRLAEYGIQGPQDAADRPN